jgi:hypothetical protein
MSSVMEAWYVIGWSLVQIWVQRPIIMAEFLLSFLNISSKASGEYLKLYLDNLQFIIDQSSDHLTIQAADCVAESAIK